MFFGEHAPFEGKHCPRRDHAAQQDPARTESPPHFLAQALDWVEFRRIALVRQGHYLTDSPNEDVLGGVVKTEIVASASSL
jgi:hypothetical protein